MKPAQLSPGSKQGQEEKRRLFFSLLASNPLVAVAAQGKSFSEKELAGWKTSKILLISSCKFFF